MKISDNRREVPPAGTIRDVNAEAETRKPLKDIALSQKAVFKNRADVSSASNSPPLNVLPQNPLSQNIVENSSGQTQIFTAREIFRQTAAALGFPRDILSVTILAFSHFFSLSPNAALVGNLRREILSLLKNSPPGNAAEKAALEAEVPAAAAAFDKGVSLTPEALEHYARFFSVPAQAVGGEGAGTGGGKKPPDRKESPDAEELRAIAEDGAEEDGLLEFLNAVPGKNGQRWMVFPFKITVKGTVLSVFLRILKREAFAAGENACIIADISGPKRTWRFFLDRNAGNCRADIQVYPELSAKALAFLEKKAKRFFEKKDEPGRNFPGFEEIRVRNGKESPSWADDLCGEPLPSVNKEV